MHMNPAVMTLLSKPNKDLTLPSSYRPLSLINTHFKIITKTLATRIEVVTPMPIHPDQTGFIKTDVLQIASVGFLIWETFHNKTK